MKILNIMIAALYRSLQERFEDYDKSYMAFFTAKFSLLPPISVWITIFANIMKNWFHWIDNDFSQVPFIEYIYIIIPVMIFIAIITWNVDKIHSYAEDSYNYTSLKMGKILYFSWLGLGIFMTAVLS
ncbi:hypothetical protein [Siphonobacter sp. SORGH_AS_1065]|uniref:hypothetical protein n=1 Tax=Siphonobacter sp. SORGH_AS_1065 TaxID=3041795 RepID=UPI0027804B9F|nr:hypothetical protein [Siphonobacter sp. SORGH_AS_1065]MDQ1087563.1 hypothetical protein [Siphonobacter sp. SORGH_AS_1065]